MDCSAFVQSKSGIEIGGPSQTLRNFYSYVHKLDNVIFSKHTVWHQFQSDKYNFGNGKTGSVIEADACQLPCSDESYDFLVSSHTLEHIANPLKALIEWKRVIKKGGHLILILPEKSHCFDHKRDYTKFNVILEKYLRNVGEDNLDSLGEILKNHDLSLDKPAGTFEQFVRRSLNNYENRCLHHHVFNSDLVSNMAIFTGLELLQTQIDGLDMWFLLKK